MLAVETCCNTTTGDNTIVLQGQCDMKQDPGMQERRGRPWIDEQYATDHAVHWQAQRGTVDALQSHDRRIVDLDDPDNDSDEDIAVKSEPSPDTSNVPLTRLHSRRDRKSNSVKRKSRIQPQIRYMSVLQRGNADPFNAAGITITPQVNQILMFARDICLPAFYFQDSLRDASISAQSRRDVTNPSGWISSPAARRGWQQVVDALNDKCTAYACLSTYLALMAACDINPAKATEASLKMRAGSSALLRQRLIQQNAATSTVEARQEILWQVFWHFYAEFFAGNMKAAQIHGRMIRQSCETAEDGIITPHFLDSVIFVDMHMSAKYMTRTVLDIEEWVPKVFDEIWSKIDPNMAEITKEDGADLHPTIPGDPLQSIFVRTRQSLILLRQSSESQTADIDNDTLFYWLNSHAYVDGGKTIDLYLNLVDQALRAPSANNVKSDNWQQTEPSTSTSIETSGYLYTQACLCLCALYSIRDIGQEIMINLIDIVDASSTISKYLLESLVKALTTCTPEERRKYRPAHLWCAYTGALIEQRDADPTTRSRSTTFAAGATAEDKHHNQDIGSALRRPVTVPEGPTPLPVSSFTSIASSFSSQDPSTRHFNSLFAELSYSMSLLSWQQVADMLKRFVYTDTAEPHGSRWFWKTMGAYLDRRKRFEEMKKREAEKREQSDVEAFIGRTMHVADSRKSREPERPDNNQGGAIKEAMQSAQTQQRRWSTVEGQGKQKKGTIRR